MDGELRLLLEEDGADAERVDVLTGHLRRELAQLDVEAVRPLPAGEAPPGTRGFDAATVGGLLVTLGPAASGLAAVVTAIRGLAVPVTRPGTDRSGRARRGRARAVAGVRGPAGPAHRDVREPPRVGDLTVTGRRKALVVAVDEYDDPGLRRLRSPAADAEALAAVLGDPAVAAFDVQVSRNEEAYQVQARIDDLFAEARADDVVLLHFSGHGLKNEAGELFLAARTTKPGRLASTAVAAEFVQRCMRDSASRSIVLLLDCCYGGAFGEGVAVRAAGDVHVLDSFPTGRLAGGRGRAVISASNAMEYAFEGGQLRADALPEPSPFTAALVRGLATGEADRDEDGWVSLNELYDYVFDRVRAGNPNQTPTRDIEMQGELYLARSTRRRIEPAPLPRDLQAALDDANAYSRLGAVAELRSRLLSENLPVAAGARAALARVAEADTRLVAESAAEALRQLRLSVTPAELSFGPLPPGSPSDPQRLDTAGPPLARAATATSAEDWIRVSAVDAGYEVVVFAPGPGRSDGTVTLTAAGVTVVVPVTVEGAAPGPGPPDADSAAPPAPGSTQAALPDGPVAARGPALGGADGRPRARQAAEQKPAVAEPPAEQSRRPALPPVAERSAPAGAGATGAPVGWLSLVVAAPLAVRGIEGVVDTGLAAAAVRALPGGPRRGRSAAGPASPPLFGSGLPRGRRRSPATLAGRRLPGLHRLRRGRRATVPSLVLAAFVLCVALGVAAALVARRVPGYGRSRTSAWRSRPGCS